jgi:hypothetical protein
MAGPELRRFYGSRLETGNDGVTDISTGFFVPNLQHFLKAMECSPKESG